MKSYIRMNNQGFFIVFDGLDGVGKTTLANIMCKKYNAEYMRALNSSDNATISTANKNSLPSLTIHKLSLKFIKNTAEKILLLNKAGINVILDRYVYSCIAYYYAISKVNKQEILPIDYEFYKFPCPDIIFFINTDIQNILFRNMTKHPDFTDGLTHNNQIFRQCVLQCLCKMQALKNVHWIDNNHSIEATSSLICSKIDATLKTNLRKETAQHYTNAELSSLFHTH